MTTTIEPPGLITPEQPEGLAGVVSSLDFVRTFVDAA